jgi:hypothetical protein
MMKLTKRNLDCVKPNPTHDQYLWDDGVPGFGLRAKPSGAKSFFIQYRNSRGSSRRFTLGKFGVLAPDQARKMAKAKLAEVAKGGDPAEERSQDRAAMTVRPRHRRRRGRYRIACGWSVGRYSIVRSLRGDHPD